LGICWFVIVKDWIVGSDSGSHPDLPGFDSWGQHVAIPDHGSTFGSIHGRQGLVGARMDPGYLADLLSGRVRELTVVQKIKIQLLILVLVTIRVFWSFFLFFLKGTLVIV